MPYKGEKINVGKIKRRDSMMNTPVGILFLIVTENLDLKVILTLTYLDLILSSVFQCPKAVWVAYL
jgi:hypothetical protein